MFPTIFGLRVNLSGIALAGLACVVFPNSNGEYQFFLGGSVFFISMFIGVLNKLNLWRQVFR